MSLKLPIEPGTVLYDPDKDWLLVYSGFIVEDDLGQPAMFCHHKDWKDGADLNGVIYTVWIAKQNLFKVGDL